ncbi:hypothetical protein RDV84_20100 [Lysobacter yananisis]|uniref:HAD family hydrolase n=1 Tax=Lysobacter yananisis TaxID=1003114 RepID=A0ABY9P7W1_9GAMM|nr:hypothetical protein [Lysobacter yananisis]WMT02246.1 hypothetical protein RDV84_20100 [Lysobacter yananisis]
MRIAFDIDGTLTPLGAGQFPAAPLPFPLRLLWREPLREGTVALMRELQADGHEVWVYTSSLRSPAYLRLWLRCAGIRLAGVVNGDAHAQALRGRAVAPSKFPPAFGIDVLVDDSAGVAMEGEAHGFRVVLVAPGDRAWADNVRAACRTVPAR